MRRTVKGIEAKLTDLGEKLKRGDISKEVFQVRQESLEKILDNAKRRNSRRSYKQYSTTIENSHPLSQSGFTSPSTINLPPDSTGTFDQSRVLADRYKILQELGRGGMGVVYLAEDISFGGERKVAIKVLPAEINSHKERMLELKKEFLTASRLVHQNICGAYDFGEDKNNNTYFLVIEYLDGKTLHFNIKRNKTFTIEEALPIIQQIASGLDFAHTRGILHLDVKPANIMILPSGDIKIMDFGLAQQVKSDKSHVSLDKIAGTPLYMAPEQLDPSTERKRVSSATDVWALSVIIYEMLQGKSPFRGSNELDVAQKILTIYPEPIDSISEHLWKIIQKGLSKDWTKRFQNCQELYQALLGYDEKENQKQEAELEKRRLAALEKRKLDEEAYQKSESVRRQIELGDEEAYILRKQQAQKSMRNIEVKSKSKVRSTKEFYEEESFDFVDEPAPSIEPPSEQKESKKQRLTKKKTKTETHSKIDAKTKKKTKTEINNRTQQTRKQTGVALQNERKEIKTSKARSFFTKFMAIVLFAFIIPILGLPSILISLEKVKEEKEIKDKSEKLSHLPSWYSPPEGWPLDIWQACWNGEFVDFTTISWTYLPYSKQAEYSKSYQLWYAQKQKKEVLAILRRGGTQIKMMLIPPGKFWMGSPLDEKNRYSDEVQHKVTISQAFWMGKYEVTQDQWVKIMGKNPSRFKNANKPVETVDWKICQKFCKKLHLKLPTEAQWEYACRAGTTTAYGIGYKISTNLVNYDGANSQEEFFGDFRETTIEVGALPNANSWGCHDFHGNVREWCSDWRGDYPTEDQIDPTGPKEGFDRVSRGGSWISTAKICRSAYRIRFWPDMEGPYFGLRVCCDLDEF